MILHPRDWPRELLLAVLIVVEAEGESDIGQVAVAAVALNRERAWGASLWDTLVRAKQFEGLDPDAGRLLTLDDLSDASWARAVGNAERALAGVDPTHGALHFLNPDATRLGRRRAGLGDTLPKWAADPLEHWRVDEAKVKLREGRHVFLA